MGTILCINGLFYKWVEVAAAGLRLFQIDSGDICWAGSGEWTFPLSRKGSRVDGGGQTFSTGAQGGQG